MQQALLLGLNNRQHRTTELDLPGHCNNGVIGKIITSWSINVQHFSYSLSELFEQDLVIPKRRNRYRLRPAEDCTSRPVGAGTAHERIGLREAEGGQQDRLPEGSPGAVEAPRPHAHDVS